jgi:hypothetical protein
MSDRCRGRRCRREVPIRGLDGHLEGAAVETLDCACLASPKQTIILLSGVSHGGLPGLLEDALRVAHTMSATRPIVIDVAGLESPSGADLEAVQRVARRAAGRGKGRVSVRGVRRLVLVHSGADRPAEVTGRLSSQAG